MLARAAHTVTLCLSKGLGAPAGSVAAGSSASMHSVRRWRKALGGGMRQAGVLAAAALASLDDLDAALSRDHALARRLRLGLEAIAAEARERARGGAGGAGLVVHDVPVPTNMVVFEVQGFQGVGGGDSGTAGFCVEMDKRGVQVFPYGRRGEAVRYCIRCLCAVALVCAAAFRAVCSCLPYTCTRPPSSRHMCEEVQTRTECNPSPLHLSCPHPHPQPHPHPRAVSRRAVTHRDVDEAGIDAALQAARDVLGLL